MTDRRSPDRPDFDRLGELFPAGTPGAAGTGRSSAAPSGPVSPGDDLSQRLAAVWADVVGAEVAENARPVQLRDGRLVVTTSSSAWAQTLQFMSPMVVAGLNERLGEGSVEKAVFRHAGWDVFAPLHDRTGGGAQATGRQGRGERKPGRRVAPDAAAPVCASSSAAPAAPAGDAREDPRSSGLGAPAAAPVSAAAPGAPADDLEAFSAEEKQALADLERLPLAPSTKETIREAMKAGFARARQDNGRS
jgi:Dna[CI] antecedent, DciA